MRHTTITCDKCHAAIPNESLCTKFYIEYHDGHIAPLDFCPDCIPESEDITCVTRQ